MPCFKLLDLKQYQAIECYRVRHCTLRYLGKWEVKSKNILPDRRSQGLAKIDLKRFLFPKIDLKLLFSIRIS